MGTLLDARPAIFVDEGGSGRIGRSGARLSDLGWRFGDVAWVTRGTGMLTIGGCDQVRHGRIFAVGLPFDTSKAWPLSIAFCLPLDWRGLVGGKIAQETDGRHAPHSRQERVGLLRFCFGFDRDTSAPSRCWPGEEAVVVLVVGVLSVASVRVAESGVGVVEGGAKSGLSCMVIAR